MLIVLLSACGGGSSGSGDGGGGGGAAMTGLDARPSNLTCMAPNRVTGNADIALEDAFVNLPAFTSVPLTLLQAPGDDTRWFAAERDGIVRVFQNSQSVSAFDTDFISVAVNSASEGGLLGMAFDPDYAVNGRVYLSWTQGNPMQSVVARFTSSDGGQTLDPGSYQEIIRVDQDAGNHNGGAIAFGPDGFLYFGLGDGGGADDPLNRSQDTTNLLGAMLRLDVSGNGPAYAIPSDNPFAGNALCPADHSSATSCPEIYAWGLRNPWRWSFDALTGELWLGDVGQDMREEIDIIERNGNYGWDCREGAIANATGAAPSCPAAGFVEPVHDYGRSLGVSVTGGYVYRGAAIDGLTGSYLFADAFSGRLWRLVDDGQGGYASEELLDSGGSALSFAEGNDGELYVLNGGIQRIVDGGGSSGGGGIAVASLLSATGCFDPQEPSQPVSGLIPYDVAAPFWSDNAEKERWFAIPDGTTISVDADGDFEFPAGSVLAKHFRLAGDLVETRLFMRHPDGAWAGYSYEWNAAGTDAELVVGGKVADKNGQDWVYPSGGECLNCHTAAAGFSLGPEVAQLNFDFQYAATGRTFNQLATLDDIGVFASPLSEPSSLPAFVHPEDSTAPLDARARAYMHTNCSQCHRPGGPAGIGLDFRAATLLENTGACSVAPNAGDLGIANALIIAPGEPARSVLSARTALRDANGMPPLASNLVDTDGVAMLEAWITGLDPACQ